MNHRTGLDRSQTLLFPERPEDYIAAENPVRFLDAFVASLDLIAPVFSKARCAETGRPPYDPAALLKLYLHGYLHRVRSSLLLEPECERNVELIWLLGKLRPGFKTIADFLKDSLKPLKAVCRQFTLLNRKLELFGGELLARWDEAEKQVSVTDPDSRKMPAAQGNQVGYNAQLAVDARHKLICADDVTNEVNDLRQLANLSLEAQANLELKQAEVVADAGYYNASEVSCCVEANIQPLIPKADTSANTARGLCGNGKFQFDAQKDVYVCPGDQELT
jgi:transposase